MTTAIAPLKLDFDDLTALLQQSVTDGASDIVIKHLSAPVQKRHGQWEVIPDLPPITMQDTSELLKLILGDKRSDEFQKQKEADFQLPTPTSRFRVNAAIQRGGVFMTFRPIPTDPPKLEDLNLLDEAANTETLRSLINLPRGLVLVTGPTGSGKSTTLAAMVNYINRTKRRHIVTIEDPIEFWHNDDKCVIEQREVGTDTHGFSNALRGVLRQTPDIILVGEMRDPETIESALTAAETGHLVLSTVHTNSAPQSISRILDVISGDRINQVRTQLAATLKGVVTQQLVPKKEGTGRQIALEIMLIDDALRAKIMDPNLKGNQSYYDHMHSTQKHGNVLMDYQLAMAVRMGRITEESARSRMAEAARFDTYLNSADVPTQSQARSNAWTR